MYSLPLLPSYISVIYIGLEQWKEGYTYMQAHDDDGKKIHSESVPVPQVN